MPSLFEEMQEARRRGELALPEEKPEPVEVTFTGSVVPGAALCEACWCLVDYRVTAAHASSVHGVTV